MCVWRIVVPIQNTHNFLEGLNLLVHLYNDVLVKNDIVNIYMQI